MAKYRSPVLTFDRPHSPVQDSDMESQSAHVAAADVQWVQW